MARLLSFPCCRRLRFDLDAEIRVNPPAISRYDSSDRRRAAHSIRPQKIRSSPVSMTITVWHAGQNHCRRPSAASAPPSRPSTPGAIRSKSPRRKLDSTATRSIQSRNLVRDPCYAPRIKQTRRARSSALDRESNPMRHRPRSNAPQRRACVVARRARRSMWSATTRGPESLARRRSASRARRRACRTYVGTHARMCWPTAADPRC